jgi:peptidoglycan hydrolase-like protein with peptidoglycan-binding domain
MGGSADPAGLDTALAPVDPTALPQPADAGDVDPATAHASLVGIAAGRDQPSGVPIQDPLDALIGGGTILRPGEDADPAAARSLQNRLVALGFLKDGNVSASYDATTVKAVRLLQQSLGIGIDGEFGPGTLKAIEEAEQLPIMSTKTSDEAWHQGVSLGVIPLVVIDDHTVSIPTALVVLRMKRDAAQAGISLVVNSGFRTMAKQQELFELFQEHKGNLAAKPGFSNHQDGVAVDWNTGPTTDSAVYRWLEANAHKYGWMRTVPSEAWHWEYRPEQMGLV